MGGLENMVWGACKTVFPEGISLFLVEAHFCLPWGGENLPLKTAFLAFGPQPQEADPEPSRCLLSCLQAGAESGQQEPTKDHAFFTA